MISKEISLALDGVKTAQKETLCAHIYLAKSKTALYFKVGIGLSFMIDTM